MKLRSASLILAILLLLGCAPARAGEESVLIFIEEGDLWQVENNALRVAPGDDAVFTVLMERSVMLTGTDYAGEADIVTDGRIVTLTLKDVRYPTRVKLTVSTKYCTVTYHANGGTGLTGEETVSRRYGLSTHPRPNTETGAGLFTRESHTLTGWNTRADGQGTRIGLGSRVTPVNGAVRLYAQWAAWADEADFDRTEDEEGITVTGYRGKDEKLAVPAYIGGKPVRTIAAGAFDGCASREIILPDTIRTVEDGAFRDCALTELTLFDSVSQISDDAFTDCPGLTTLRINAIEAPYGYIFRKESAYADKVEMLLAARGRKKLVFYGGCSMWYNLDAIQADRLFGDEYVIINMGLNGTVSSAVQMQIMAPYLEEGDVLFHTPELSSCQQLMLTTELTDNDSSLWCGLENNYDLFTAVDLKTVSGVFSSLCHYLGMKDRRTDYQQFFSDDYRTPYLDRYGSVPFYRSGTKKNLGDQVSLDPGLIGEGKLETLAGYYALLRSQGVRVYVSYACVNMDAVPEEQRDNVAVMDRTFRGRIDEMPGVSLISELNDYLFRNTDFYDTNYHLCSEPAKANTAKWMADLSAVLSAKEAAADEE